MAARGALLMVLYISMLASPAITQKPEPDDWPSLSIRLQQMLSSPSREERRDALFIIRNLETVSASRLAVSALRDSDEVVRATAAASVIFLPDEEAARSLLPMLDDRAAFVRKEAAYSLGKAANSMAVGRLITTLQRDRDREVRVAAAIALGQIGDRSALEPLAVILRERPREEDQMLRRAAARAIGQTAENTRFGVIASTTPHSFLPDRYKQGDGTQPAAAEGTPMAQFAEYVPLLISILQSTSEVADTRREAAFALGTIGSPTAIAVLQRYSQSTDPYLAEISREALLKIPSEQSPDNQNL